MSHDSHFQPKEVLREGGYESGDLDLGEMMELPLSA